MLTLMLADLEDRNDTWVVKIRSGRENELKDFSKEALAILY